VVKDENIKPPGKHMHKLL